MYIQLEEEDYKAISSMICEHEDTNSGYIEYEELMEIRFSKDVTEHQDTHYYTGTGEWIVDDVEFSILDIICNYEVKYDENKLYEIIEDTLWGRQKPLKKQMYD